MMKDVVAYLGVGRPCEVGQVDVVRIKKALGRGVTTPW
jgi:hypothetical protein